MNKIIEQNKNITPADIAGNNSTQNQIAKRHISTVSNTTSSKRALTISEAAEYACVSRGSVESWLAKGLLSYEELPRTGEKQHFRRIRKKDLDAFLDRNLRANKAPHHQSDNGEHKGIFLLPKTT